MVPKGLQKIVVVPCLVGFLLSMCSFCSFNGTEKYNLVRSELRKMRQINNDKNFKRSGRGSFVVTFSLSARPCLWIKTGPEASKEGVRRTDKELWCT